MVAKEWLRRWKPHEAALSCLEERARQPLPRQIELL